VQGQLGQPAFLVRKGGFDDEELEILDAVDDVPQGVVRPRIPRENQAALAAVQL
jgi:hypothetical protein